LLPSLPLKLWSTVSVQGLPEDAGGFNKNTVPQPEVQAVLAPP
jgi:hypothetical protein